MHSHEGIATTQSHHMLRTAIHLGDGRHTPRTGRLKGRRGMRQRMAKEGATRHGHVQGFFVLAKGVRLSPWSGGV